MESPQSRTQEVLDAVLERAARDSEFRRALLESPRAAIHQAFGVRVPDDVRLKFIERDPDLDALVVLPDLIDDTRTLSDDELDGVSGGAGGGSHLMWRGALKTSPRSRRSHY
ncbi:MAG: NHLP leader peptide family RiPP precursor [Gemmatimonadaceae bacterium]|nr:NHLP leader peptide family RiPP precursor [Gemmatimonadaceae bacterium]